MYYKFVLYLLLAALPGVYLHFYLPVSGRIKARKMLLGMLSLLIIYMLTQHISDATYLQYMAATLPFAYAIYYAGRVWGIIIPLVLLCTELLTFSTSEGYVQYFTYLLLIVIVFQISYERYHKLEARYRLGYIMVMLSLSSLLLILYSFQFSNLVPAIFEEIGLLGTCFYALLYFALSLLSFGNLLKHEQALHINRQYESMKQSRDELQSWLQVIHYAPFAVFNINSQEQIIYANQQAYLKYESLTPHLTQRQRQKQKLEEILTDTSYPIVSKLIEQAFLTSQSINTTLQNEDKDLLYSAIPIYTDTEPELDHNLHAVALFVQDVTELQTLRRELDRMDRLSIVGEMAASITHEIRNPMAVVRGYVQLLQERSDTMQAEYFRIIIEELDRTNKIITDFLALAQNKKEQKLSYSLNHVIQKLLPLLQADANLRGQTLEVELSNDLPTFQINETEMKQLLLNISRNGMEAMQQGGQLSISTTYAHSHIILSISDTGSGIPDELKHKIFEPFYSSKSMGTGLGLPLCANIVQRHNGKINVLDNRGQGTVFQIVFPLEQQLLSS